MIYNYIDIEHFLERNDIIISRDNVAFSIDLSNV